MMQVEAAFSAVCKKNAPWLVTSAMRNAFEYNQEQVASMDILGFPDGDRPFYVDADVLHLGLGTILDHYGTTNTKKLPLRFMAHVFTAAALKWSTIEKDCYAQFKALNTFENVLFGRTFIVHTDHRYLLWMQHSINAQVQRLFTYLHVFQFMLERIPVWIMW